LGLRKEMTPSDLILHTLRTYHRGKARAITRDALREYLRQMGYRISDRELRAIYAELPVCTCEKGIFWPETIAELEEYRRYLRAKALPLFVRWQRVADAHPGLINTQQKELFI